MQVRPLEYVRQRAFRKVAIHSALLDLHCDFEVAINGVEVRRPVIAVIHGNDNTQEATQFRHSPL